jgi:hypothetical protein
MISHLIVLTLGYVAGSVVTMLIVIAGCYYGDDDDNNSGTEPV